MASRRHPRRRTKLVLALFGGGLALAAGVVTFAPGAEGADDIDLLRKQGGTPYVFFLVDTSGSMVLDPNDQWVPANGDDPRSKLYQVKQALYDVLSGVEGVQFGFAGFNQDRLRVSAKHWLYTAETTAVLAPGLTYPTAVGQQWTFGRHINENGHAGTCAAPLSLSAGLQRLNRFPKLGVTGLQQTTLWVTHGGKKYRILASLSPASAGDLGSATMAVRLEAGEVVLCDPVEVAVGADPTDVIFRRVQDFLMVESNGTSSSIAGCTSSEQMAGVWPYTAVLADNTCGSGSSAPHTGQGADTNTDSGDRTGHDDLDRCCVALNNPGVCVANPNPSHVCYNLRFEPTQLHEEFPELDLGDWIPMSWEADYQDQFLRRLNPKHPGGRDFGIASYFRDQPDATTGLLQLKNPLERPLIGFGNSPLGRAITDFRCWYRGKESNKCAGGDSGPAFDPGWEAIFRDKSLQYGCRVPYLIVISDGEDNSEGPSPTSEVANLWSKAGVRTFVFSFKQGTLNSIVNAGRGELILVSNGQQLATELARIIGFIQEESRTFASAAVPSVQAAVEDKIFLTEFTSLNESGLWPGRVHSFLKPLPLDEVTARPDTTHENHLWDAAQVMLDQAPAQVAGDTSGVDLKLGSGVDQRRVYYALEPDPGDPAVGSWPENRRLFDRTTEDLERVTPIEPVEPDLWKGLGLIASADGLDEEEVKETRRAAHSIIEKTLIQKAYTSEETGTIEYILGDIFHSNPVVIGSPVNTLYFIQDAEETFVDQGGEQVAQGTGYRQFFLTHENRRKIVVAGANDGMLHAWDAGKARIVRTPKEDHPTGIAHDEVQFDNGTGRELFAYVPRSVLPALNRLANEPASHQWSVDGSVAAADVFIDPLHDGTPDPGAREWRTVLIGGLREGGSAYYALDITHPDHLEVGEIGPVPPPREAEAQRREVLIPSDQGVIPDCIDSTTGGCPGPLPYPAPLWEFTDRIWDPTAGEDGQGEFVALDEDGNRQPDLGETWSTPDIGRIRVVENDVVVTKFVAVFGGGLGPGQGNFLYIVDFETGEVLYKRQVEGSVPSDPAAVDTNQDGFLDRVYFGTTAGFMYRLDLVRDVPSEIDRYPRLVSTNVGVIEPPGREIATVRIERGDPANPLWEPVKIFTTEGRPIYYPPTVLFVAKLGRYAIGFGTGERASLGSKTDDVGRFYTFVDDTDHPDRADPLPQTETSFTRIEADGAVDEDALGRDLLGDPTLTPGRRGWFLVLQLEERLISPPAGLIGVTFFATFRPEVVNETCEVGPGCNQDPQCSLTGSSRIYVVGSASADGLLKTVDGVDRTRFMDVHGFVTQPFTEQALTRSRRDGSDGGRTADDLSELEREVMESLKQLMPANCRFGNHRIDIKLIAADTRLERIAAVPICIIEKNWMEVTD